MSKTRFQCALLWSFCDRRTCAIVVTMTSCSSLQQQQQHAKFRWTEKLTCRFIQLRRDHAKMFTGRKYSAQQGWEYILKEMRDEFPAIMSDVHYRVLKKKWSNLLQQYKELKNPVHGDKNRADDISWPFYSAIDEVIASLSLSADNNFRRRRSRRRVGANCINDDDDEHHDNEDLNPQEFLCVSVQSPDDDNDETTIDYERIPPVSSLDTSVRRSSSSELLSRLPPATELTIRPVKREFSSDEENVTTRRKPRKSCRNKDEEEGLERRIVEFMEYTKQRDEENRSILTRMLEALEDIRNALR